MKSANDPNVNYKARVQAGYDRAAAAYAEARRGASHPELRLLTERLPIGAAVLDIGCGAGVPIAQALAQKFAVTGVDISGEQIRLARTNVPQGIFLHGDIMALDFPPASFDAVVSFYALFHLPREEHPELLRRIHGWLRPGGLPPKADAFRRSAPGGCLLATVTQTAEEAYTEDDFFGVTMYWSNYGLDDYRRLLTEIGFVLLDTTVIGHGYGDEHPAEVHPLIFAQK
jgi:SAM-dependent methyltransferase